MQTVLSKIENLKNKSNKRKQAPPAQTNAKPKHKNGTKSRKQKHLNVYPSDSITALSHRSEWDASDFVRVCQPQLTKSQKDLWLIRHGERVDEVRTDEYTLWQKQMTTHITRLFDPPLTANGFQQASNRGHLLMEELAQIENEEDRPKCIYTSPTLRTLGTAMEIAKVIKLPIVVIPGLSACAAAVKRGKLIKEKVTAENNDEDEMAAAVAIYQLEEYGNPVEMAKRQKNVNVDADVVNEDEKANDSNVNGHNESTDDKDEIKENGVVPSENKPNDASKDKVLGFDEESDMKDGVENAKHPLLNTFKKTAEYELFLKSYGMFGKCEFLTKLEILEQFGKDGVQIFFDYQHIERFRVSLERLVSEADSKVVLCVTHREGIRNIDGRLMSTHIPYCALAKYGVVPQTSSIGLDTFDFLYYTD